MSAKSTISAEPTPPARSAAAIKAAGWRRREAVYWIVEDVLYPLLLSRIALLLVGWFSAAFPVNAEYPIQEAVDRGWHFSPHRLLDIWGRWDSGWYFSIIREGYYLNGELESVQSNVAFFPLYPYLVKALLLLVPDAWETPGVVLLVGVVLSNLLLLIALILLHHIVISIFAERSIARWSIAYLLAFPTGFVLSSFYTESLFLCLAMGAVWAATKKMWWLAALCGCLLGLTRPLGVLILVPLLWFYGESIGWQLRKIRLDLAYLALIPLGLLLFLSSLQQISGDFLAPMVIQQAWQRELMSPIQALFNPSPHFPFITPIAQVLTAVFLGSSLLAFWIFPSMGYGLYSILMLAPTLIHGTLLSNGRYYLVIFPVFIVMARLIRRSELRYLVLVILFTLQILYMVAWSQFYWVE